MGSEFDESDSIAYDFFGSMDVLKTFLPGFFNHCVFIIKQLLIHGVISTEDLFHFRNLIDHAVEKGSAFKADSLTELQEAEEVDADTFVETVMDYNEMLKTGEDTQFVK